MFEIILVLGVLAIVAQTLYFKYKRKQKPVQNDRSKVTKKAVQDIETHLSKLVDAKAENPDLIIEGTKLAQIDLLAQVIATFESITELAKPVATIYNRAVVHSDIAFEVAYLCKQLLSQPLDKYPRYGFDFVHLLCKTCYADFLRSNVFEAGNLEMVKTMGIVNLIVQLTNRKIVPSGFVDLFVTKLQYRAERCPRDKKKDILDILKLLLTTDELAMDIQYQDKIINNPTFDDILK